MRRIIVGLGAMLAFGLGAPPAHGWACAGEPLHLFPESGEIPTNARVRVVFARDPNGVSLLGPQNQVLAWATVSSANAKFFFFGGGAAAPVRARELPGTLATRVLEPTLPLVPSTTYDLVIRAESDAHVMTDFPIAHYRTRATADTTAPTLVSIKSSRVHHLAHAESKEAWGPWIDLDLAGVADDQGPIFYEIYDATPTLLATVSSLRFGHHDVCRASEIAIAPKGIMKLNVRVIDAAGNGSTMLPFMADVDHPITTR